MFKNKVVSLGEKRLLSLSHTLETKADPERYNQRYWGQFRKSAQEAAKRAVKWVTFAEYKSCKGAKRDINHCGTAACALGWGTVDPMLRRAGLSLVTFADYTDGHIALVKNGVVTVEGPFSVAKTLFGINDERCNQMFGSERDTGVSTLKQAARNIRQRVKEIKAAEGFLI